MEEIKGGDIKIATFYFNYIPIMLYPLSAKIT